MNTITNATNVFELITKTTVIGIIRKYGKTLSEAYHTYNELQAKVAQEWNEPANIISPRVVLANFELPNVVTRIKENPSSVSLDEVCEILGCVMTTHPDFSTLLHHKIACKQKAGK